MDWHPVQGVPRLKSAGIGFDPQCISSIQCINTPFLYLYSLPQPSEKTGCNISTSVPFVLGQDESRLAGLQFVRFDSATPCVLETLGQVFLGGWQAVNTPFPPKHISAIRSHCGAWW